LKAFFFKNIRFLFQNLPKNSFREEPSRLEKNGKILTVHFFFEVEVGQNSQVNVQGLPIFFHNSRRSLKTCQKNQQNFFSGGG